MSQNRLVKQIMIHQIREILSSAIKIIVMKVKSIRFLKNMK